MNRISLLNEVGLFMINIKNDYQDNIISKDKYELMQIELSHLVNEIATTELIISITKFNTIKTIYLIMR